MKRPTRWLAYEVSGTITTGVRVYCPDCELWFAEWTSRELYPTIARRAKITTMSTSWSVVIVSNDWIGHAMTLPRVGSIRPGRLMISIKPDPDCVDLGCDHPGWATSEDSARWPGHPWPDDRWD